MALEGMQFGSYRLLRLIGSGGMGEVYLAEDTRIGRQVAIKVVRIEADPYPVNARATQDALRLFQREMKAIATLDHPNILPLIDFGEQAINKAVLTYMVMPFRPEGSLVDWLHQQGSQDILSPQEVVHIVLQAASALQHAHNRQLMHLDVKPSNFLVRLREDSPLRPDLLLADFGIAKFNTATATASQSVRGTPAYMAPEQWAGSPVTATDQYALAIMAYQLLTGRSPFLGNMQQVMYQHLQELPKAPATFNSRIPTDVDSVILRALAKKPEDRFLSVQAFATAFEQGWLSAATPPKPKGDDIKATLFITETEALTGTTRLLAFPGGRQVIVSVPAGAQNDQVLRLEGQGEPSKAGGPSGTLILTFAIMQPEKALPAPNPGGPEKPARDGDPKPEKPTDFVSRPDTKKPAIFMSHPRVFVTLVVLALSIGGAVVGGLMGANLESMYCIPVDSGQGTIAGSVIGFTVILLASIAVIVLIGRFGKAQSHPRVIVTFLISICGAVAGGIEGANIEAYGCASYSPVLSGSVIGFTVILLVSVTIIWTLRMVQVSR